MRRCKVIDFLITVFPFKFWQDFLIHKHISRCESCRNRLADKTDIYSLLIQVNDIENIKDFWPEVKASLQKKEVGTLRSKLFPGKWVFRTAVFLAVVMTGLWIYNNFGTKKPQTIGGSQERFHINYIKIDNKPAQTYFYQLKDSEMIIIWAEKANLDK